MLINFESLQTTKEMQSIKTIIVCKQMFVSLIEVGLGGLGVVLASRSEVCGFKSGWSRCIFSGRKNPEHKSSGRNLKLGVFGEL